ncbi:hypothetical protein RM531_08415 [Salinisphaera sp. P385]|uniref:Uncharacterized protein n=1 Tax=Spectribacter acetivorans TaxID=3075603 RepID=A0ABU3B7Q8_9GAMM|nr:hypothetical protein [Salinisphaera sp. P385]MDT0618499.1 hypothetical protein [Salinisphaera sp. P385]
MAISMSDLVRPRVRDLACMAGLLMGAALLFSGFIAANMLLFARLIG